MSPEKRSVLMSRIKGKDTGPERTIAAALAGLGLTWESHVGEIPGRPDFVFRQQKVLIFVDGDFWHGWRFPRWRDKLSEKWDIKIAQNRMRDRRNHAKLRRQGWTVVRIWEHQIERDVAACLSRIKRILDNPTRPTATQTTGAELRIEPPISADSSDSPLLHPVADVSGGRLGGCGRVY
jgi:DNA mismatch endonuclease, patch repair protein